MKKFKKVAVAVTLSLSMIAGIVAFKSGESLNVNAAGSTNLLSYSNAVGHVGTCINSWQLRDQSLLKQVKELYNSITLENENKPDALLGQSATLISVSDAKQQGYYIPSNYTDSRVPKINFSTVDEVLRICNQNNLGYRAHTLIWHSQTPQWLFKEGYSGNGRNVSKNEMDARMEMYIKTVMKHVYDNPNGKCCYAWDIANEYLHASQCGWTQIYGNVSTQPEVLKKAFTYADEILKELGIRDEVSLFYNDYNEYEVVDKMISMVNFINGSGKVCNGVGMQSHLDTNYPSIAYYTECINKFVKAGFEIQVTELDVTCNSESVQAKYYYDIMKALLTAKKNGANITGITLWGMYDSMSWRSGQSPLLFKNNMNSPKQAYTQVLKAYDDVYGNYTPTAAPTTAPTQKPTQAPTAAPTTKPTNPPASNGVEAALKIENDWNSGAVCEITFTNKTGKTLNNWTFEFDLNRDIDTVWTGTLKSKSGNHYVVTNPAWGATLRNGESFTVKFMAGAKTADKTELSNCTLK